MSSNLYAQEIHNGMSMSTVIQRLGAPSSKTEKETLRENVWIYPAMVVIFKDGKVINHGLRKKLNTEVANSSIKSEEQKLTLLPALKDPPKFDGTVNEFFRSIEKESGSESSGGASGSSISSPPGIPNMQGFPNAIDRGAPPPPPMAPIDLEE